MTVQYLAMTILKLTESKESRAGGDLRISTSFYYLTTGLHWVTGRYLDMDDLSFKLHVMKNHTEFTFHIALKNLKRNPMKQGQGKYSGHVVLFSFSYICVFY